MSTYAKYDMISKAYDGARLPNGAHLYLGLIYSQTGKIAKNLHLLDIGCGTGTHVDYLFQRGLGKATMFDANEGMLEKAKIKLKPYIDQGRLVIEHHSLPKIPYNDATFDVVMSNQVFQHLTTMEDTEEYTVVRKTVEEAFRVLKPNGILIVQMCTPAQLKHGYWYEKVFPDGFVRFNKRIVEPERFLGMLRNTGFQKEGMYVEPLAKVYTDERYFNENGPLEAQWRNSDSLSSTVSAEELEKARILLEDLKSKGKQREFMLEADKMRQQVGQYAIYYATKS